MKRRILELLQMTAITLLLYFLYWVFAIEQNYSIARIAIDAIICMALTWISILYSQAIMHVIEKNKNIQKIISAHALILFVLDMLTAWGLSSVCELIFDSNLFVFFQNIFVFGLLTTLISAIKTNSMFWKKKFETEYENELLGVKLAEAERITAKNQLFRLQSQVNPHFFFNNLSTLSSLITTDSVSAKEFVNALALMYRDILKGTKHDVVSVKDELSLVAKYVKLLKIRHGDCIIISFPEEGDVPSNAFVPPSSIQHLVENAVKHNAMTSSSPLMINIEIINKSMIVSNNRNPLTGMEPSCGTGLANLQEQLLLLGVDDFKRFENQDTFCISFTLIFQNQSL